MYLEISGRRSGKTTRLIKDVIKNITAGINVVTVIHNKNNMINIVDSHNYAGSFDCVTYKDYILDWTMYDNHKIYFDEFDFMDNKVPILEDGYYCTTPMKMRTEKDYYNFAHGIDRDILLELVNVNDNFYKKYSINQEDMKQLSYSHLFTEDLYHRECLGNFFCEIFEEDADIDYNACDPPEYDHESEWIVNTVPDSKTKKIHDCECDMSTLILYGCKCGSIPKKRN